MNERESQYGQNTQFGGFPFVGSFRRWVAQHPRRAEYCPTAWIVGDDPGLAEGLTDDGWRVASNDFEEVANDSTSQVSSVDLVVMNDGGSIDVDLTLDEFLGDAYSTLRPSGHVFFRYDVGSCEDAMEGTVHAMRSHGFNAAWACSPVLPDIPFHRPTASSRRYFVGRRDI